ncbi:MAG: hypothetical protein HZA93_00500 [Verrucomicrobia bacterium]|nr:hypothetical protein [Verrucomicrobiota bacterium]
MVKTINPGIRRVLILKSDRLCAQALGDAARSAFPGAGRVIARSLAEARSELDRGSFELIVAGVSFGDGEIFDLIEAGAAAGNTPSRWLVVTARPARSVVRRLRELPVAGIFDAATEDPEDFSFALLSVSLGLPCLSAALAQDSWVARRCPVPSRRQPTGDRVVAPVGRSGWPA